MSKDLSRYRKEYLKGFLIEKLLRILDIKSASLKPLLDKGLSKSLTS